MPSVPNRGRPQVRGKFLCVGDEKFYVRGVTYGTFQIDEDGIEHHDPSVVDTDFAQMAANGINVVRTYTVPPRWLLDCAQRHGLYVMVGLLWNQYTAFFDVTGSAKAIEERVRAGVQSCAGHPAVLCYTIGNEIPSSIVRWYGRGRVARFLERLYDVVKREDPGSLVTYVNFPPTEYLDLPFLDFVCFNVYLESQERLEAYLSRLQTIAGNRPLILAEIGLDSRRNGEHTQAWILDWQVRTAFANGCAGVFVFAWTDEWYVLDWIEDWDFGITDRTRQPKPALASVRQAFAEVPFPPGIPWPRISVVVCSYNGARTIGECLAGLSQLDYPDYEIIVVDDGSTDATSAIARSYDVRLIRTANFGLSSGRNTGMKAASGEIVAYIDDDAWPDPHWLQYLAATFLHSTHAAIGGPNIAPPGDGTIAECVANAPGNPVQVLLSDREAEHIPGCNMAFRKRCLEEIGGFDPQFRVAGDDVDVCWRLREAGWSLGFSPEAMVWHHRRGSVRAFWRQQVAYGKAEALLERKWPEKYNVYGSMRWCGRLYGAGLTHAFGWRRGRIYQGVWGTAFFQPLYQPAPDGLWSLLLMPEWYLAIFSLAAFSVLGAFWPRLLVFTLPLLTLAVGALLVQAGVSAARASARGSPHGVGARLRLRGLTTLLHLLQPLARLIGHLRYGLTPWRQHTTGGFRLPRPWKHSVWTERWRAPEERLRAIEAALKSVGVVVKRAGDYRRDDDDRWDLEVRGGPFGAARTLMMVEEHGRGRQLVRLRSWPRCFASAGLLMCPLAALCIDTIIEGQWFAAACFGAATILLAIRTFQECARAMAVLVNAVLQAGATEHDGVA